MDRRQGLIGYLAVGLGVLALVVAIGGRWSGPQMRGDYQRRFSGPQDAAPPAQPLPTTPPAPQQPVAPQQERGFRHRGAMARGDEQGRGWGGWGDRRGFRRGERGGFGFLGGILPLAAAFLLMGLGFRLFRGGGRYGGARRWAGAPGQPGYGGWQGPHGAPPQGNPSPPDATAPPPHTGETRRFDA